MITIDDVRTRDIDDAFQLEETDNGWLLEVAIADVAGAIPLGSPLDRKAREATATRYFAEGNDPMLPRQFSEDELSLWPHKTRDVFWVQLWYNKDLSLRDLTVQLTELDSEAKLAYKDVPGILASKEHKWHSLLSNASRFAFGLLERRRAAGAMVIYDLNNGWVMTEEGFLKQLKSHEDTVGYIIIQELMIATNSALAEFAVKNDIPILFRNHQARAATPDREELLEQVRLGFERPLETLETIRRQVHMLFDKAEYGASLKGHYGLNLPAYTHFTSPIRRYADLVVHRQLRAFFQSEEMLYSKADLEEVAQHINQVTLAERQARSSAMKARAEGKAQRNSGDARRLANLSDKDIERVVKVQVRSGENPTETFEEAFRSRLGAKRLPLICLAVLMMEAPVNEVWNELRVEILKHLVQNPHEVTSLWNQAAQISGWRLPTFETQEEGPSHARTFTAKAFGEDEKGDPMQGPTLKEAKQRAAISLLKNTFGLSLPLEFKDSPVAPQAKAKKFSFSQDKDPIMVLHEYCQAQAIPMPEYSFEASGPPHMPEILCICSLKGHSGQAKARTKQEAKRKAVQVVLKSVCS